MPASASNEALAVVKDLLVSVTVEARPMAITSLQAVRSPGLSEHL